MSSSRRDFLILSSLAGATLLIQCKGAPPEGDAHRRLNFWLAIGPDGTVELRTSKLEMGQGIWTALAVLAAEELELEPSALRLVVPSTDEVRAAPAGELIDRRDRLLDTGSSRSVARSWLPVRTAAAAAREMLVAAAAARWTVPVEECRVAEGRVLHAASGRSAGYGELAAAAAKLPLPRAPKLKSPEQFRWIGRETPRVEGRGLVTGTARFSADARQPGQRFAVLARPPLGGGKLRRIDAAAARAMPGVTDVLELERGVAVIAETTWAALAGREKLIVDWETEGVAELSSAAFERTLESALDAPAVERYQRDAQRAERVVVLRRGANEGALRGAHEARYATAFQTHAPMEPPNALARFEPDGRCEVWCGTQWPQRTQERIARRFQLPMKRVVVHPQRMGGSFGRKESADFVLEAVELARRQPGAAIQLFWSREDDLRHGQFHPPSRHRLAARLERGRIAAWRHRIASPSAEKQWGSFTRNALQIPRAETSGAWNLPYVAEEMLVEYADPPCPFPLGFWRGIEIASNVFAVEGFVDELAHAAGRDPLEFRLAHLGESVDSTTVETPFALARLRAAFELAAARSGWGQPLEKGRGRGIAGLVFDGQTACASVAEVTVTGASFTVDRVVCAIDCGIVVNPLGLAGNAESAIVWGLSALQTEITFAGGRAEQATLLDYPILRLQQMPEVEIAIVPSREEPSGTGEIPVPTVAAAVANAIFQASGRRLRSLPFRLEELA